MKSTDSPDIVSGAFNAHFVFDVADTIDLNKLVSVAGHGAERAPLRVRITTSPGNIQFSVPPLAVPLSSIGVAGRTGTARAKIYDYGVISIRYSFPYAGPWTGFAALSAALRHDGALAASANAALTDILRDCAPALDDPHDTLVEDYYICSVEHFAARVEASTLLTEHAASLVSLLTAEADPLGLEEQKEALRLHFSYFPDDLVVVQWDSAFIYDSADDAEVIEDILEFANTQLVEFRTYDNRLDAELDAIYAMDVPRRVPWRPLGRRAAEKRAERLRYLLVDVRELADHASNALKIIGDAYYARIYRAVASRLSLDVWQRQIDTKLDSIGDFYRYMIDQAQKARSEFLELIVVILIVAEIIIALAALRR